MHKVLVSSFTLNGMLLDYLITWTYIAISIVVKYYDVYWTVAIAILLINL